MKDKLILVTGASADSDIGLAICKQLDSAGARLILCGRRLEMLMLTKQQLTGEQHILAPFDLANSAEITSWIKQLVSIHGSLDGIVCSASVQGYSPLKTIKPEQISSYFSVNFSAPLMLLSAMAKSGIASSSASVVLISSAAGKRGLKGRSLYAASKAALLSLTKTAALELADRSIRVNAVVPAIVTGSKSEKQFAMLGEVKSKELIAQHPLGLSSPSDIADAVHFLLSDASQRITGTELTVDGGFLAG